jgi:hypothetical protein
MSVTNGGSGPADVWIGSGQGSSSLTPASPSLRYTAAAFVQGATVGRTAVGFEVFYDSSMSALGTVFGQAVTDAPGAWAPLRQVVAIAPAGSAFVLYGLIFYGAEPGETHYVDSASLISTTAPTSGIHGPLRTSGNKIIQSDGTAVALRGVTRDGSEWSTGRFPTDAEIAQAKAWGATFVRVPLNEALWINTCSSSNPSNDPAYPAKVDAEVNSITSRAMVALLDLHFNVATTCGSASAQPMPDAAFAPSFWRTVAARYAKNTLVAFDLYNEPHDISEPVWRNGGTATYYGVSFSAAGMQQLYSAVRNQAPSNLIFATGRDWGNTPPASPLTGTNIVYAIHDYTCSEAPPPACSAPNPYNAEPVLQNWATFGVSNPVMVTEFGWPDFYDGTYLANVIAGAEARGWGWAAFSWGSQTSGPWGLVASAGATFEPSPAGMPVLSGFLKN